MFGLQIPPACSWRDLSVQVHYYRISGTTFCCAVKNLCFMNLWDVLKMFIPFYGSYLQKQDRYNRLQEAGLEEPGEPYQKFFSDLDSAANSLKDKYAGTGLTEAEREANAFTASREDIAWQRQMEADSTVYQRRVADMQAAGINPLLAAGGVGVSSPSASAGSSVSPGAGNLSGLISAISNLSLISAQKKNIEADTKVKLADARQTTQQVDYFEDVKAYRAEGERLANSLTRAQTYQVYKSLDEIDAHIKQMLESAKTEESRRELNLAQAILSKANARQVVELLPYEKAYKDAATEAEKAAALLSAANAAYQNGLIANGYIDAMVENAKAGASSATSKAELDAIKAAIRTGDYSNVKHRYGPISDILSTLSILLDNFNPLGGLIK